jgi:hypothetical protein
MPSFRLQILLAGLLFFTSCSGETKPPPPPSAEEALKELVGVYKYIEYSKLPLPRKPEDFSDYWDSMPTAFERIKQGEFIVAWGIGRSTAAGAGQQILVYEKNAATAGGGVLLRDGTVKTMTPAEFSATAIAK